MIAILILLPFLSLAVPITFGKCLERARELAFNREFGGYDTGISYLLIPTVRLDPEVIDG